MGVYKTVQGWNGIRIRFVALILACIFAGLFAFTAASTADAATTLPTKMNFQGRIANSSGNILTNGTYNMKFRIWSAASGGTQQWSEDRLVSAGQGVTVTNGQFSVQLGSVTSLPASVFTSNSLFFEVELPTPASATTGSPVWTEGAMTPRNQLATSAYAFNSETLDGLDSAAFGQLDQNNVFTGNNTFNGTLQGGSSMTLGTTSVAGALTISDGSNNTGTIAMAPTAGNYTYMIPVTTANDTFCLQTLANCGSGGGGVSTIGSLDGGTANATGASIVGSTLYLQSASVTNAGLVNTTTQSFAGNKTFTGAVNISGATTLSDNVTVASAKTIQFVGGATGSRPASPSEGTLYFDTDTKKLEVFSNGKWQADRTDAVLVAAGNSSQADKDAADYVADGNTATAADGDQVQINSALTAASGKKVVLLAGTYVADATIMIPNNTTFSGVGSGTLIELADLDATDNLIENSDISTGVGVVIQDLKIDGRSDLNTAGTQKGIFLAGIGGGSGSATRQGAKVSRIFVSRFRDNGIETNNVGHSSFTDNTVLANSTGFSFQQLIASEVRGNVSKANTTDGFSIGTSSSFINLTTNVIAENTSMGIRLTSTSNNISIKSNLISDNANSGVYIFNSNDNSVGANDFRNNGGTTNNNAIQLSGADTNSITANKIRDSSASTDNYAINIVTSTSDGNYLSDNVLGTGSINDLGTGTVYAGQTDVNGNLTIQPAANINLNKDTVISSGQLTLGTSSVAGALKISDGSSNTGTIAMAPTAGNYTYTIPVTTANDTFCLQTLANCGSGGGVTTIGALNGGTANATGASIVGTTIYLQSASANFAGLVDTTSQTFAGDKTFNGTLTVGTLSNGITLTNSGYSLAGTARNSRRITLAAEYANAVLDAGTGVNNTGSMTAGLDLTNRMNYYKWTTAQGTNQSYDVAVQVPIPSDFSAWASTTPINVTTRTSNTSTGTVTIEARDTSGAVVTGINFASITPTATGAWQIRNAGTISGTYTAGEYMTLRIRLQSPTSGDVRVGNITMDYLSKW